MGGQCHPLAAGQHPPAVVIRTTKHMNYAMQAIGLYKTSEVASSLKMRDHKDATDLIVRERKRESSMTEPAYMSDRKGHNGVTEDGTATTLNAQEKERPVVGTSIVRRLTPRECERLQGMPDDWSRWGVNENGEVYELPDSARYRLQGNGIATPFWRWMLERISALYDTPPTMGSLFDGQASFPMLWEDINGKGTAVWSSEIEKHAVAVAKYHFPEQPQDAHTSPAQPHEPEQGEKG